MTERDERDLLAAEFVLGTLEYDERRAVAARRLADAELDAAIAAWERRLAPLLDSVGEVPPSPWVLRRISAELDRQPATAGRESGGEGGEEARVVALAGRARRWRNTAIGSMLVAAGLAGVLLFRPPVPAVIAPPQQYVAVFQSDDRQPAFLFSVDLETRELVIRPVTAEARQADETYQLWILQEDLGPVPQSMGLLETVSGPTRRQLDGYDPAVLKTATFGISVEPAGGSPTGTPTGPAIHGRLYPVGAGE